jgi:uncharacterized protein
MLWDPANGRTEADSDACIHGPARDCIGTNRLPISKRHRSNSSPATVTGNGLNRARGLFSTTLRTWTSSVHASILHLLDPPSSSGRPMRSILTRRRTLARSAFVLLIALVAVMVVTPRVVISTTVGLAQSLLEQIRSKDSTFDAEMAKALEADQRGMRMYVMALLKRGPNQNQDTETAARLQKGHMDNIFRMAEEGKLIAAGPFGDNGELRGIYIFKTNSVDEATSWTESDPAIQAGRLTMELHPWYGSAALLLVNDLHRRMEAKGE